MKKVLITFILFFSVGELLAQTELSRETRGEISSEENKVEREKPPITDYRIISVENDTTVVDTSLTIEDDYRHNYLRQDNFELLPFSNVGQTYNRLAYDFNAGADYLVPEFGAQARHFNFMEAEDISYYRVPTPLTELFFKTVFEQGQILDSFFTINTSPNLNFSVAYKGLRSLGKYQHILTSTGNFRATINYHTSNERYHAKTHFVSQDLMNEENGGLTEQSLEQFLSGDEEFEDRSRLDVNFEDAQSTLFGKRFYLNHHFDLLKEEDSVVVRKLAVGHILNFSDKKYRYEQETASALFGPAYESVGLRDEVKLERIYNEGFVEYSNALLGNIKLRGGLTNYNYGYNSVLDLEGAYVSNRLKGSTFSAGASYSKQLGEFDFFADGMFGLSGDLKGSYYKSGVSYAFSEDLLASFSISGKDQAPNFNFLLYQSDYVNYNWQNDFSNVVTHSAHFALQSEKVANLEVDYSIIDNYAFFGLDSEAYVRPFQYSEAVNYFKVKAEREFSYGKLALNNTLLFQDVLKGEGVLNVPSIVTRNTLYYRDHWFRRALYLQTGFTLNYFTDYRLNGYDPVLAEFYVQNEVEFEGFPRVDFFFNARIRQARIFFKLEQVNTLLTGNDDFAAPLYPYRDFAVRFGLVWNFFL